MKKKKKEEIWMLDNHIKNVCPHFSVPLLVQRQRTTKERPPDCQSKHACSHKREIFLCLFEFLPKRGFHLSESIFRQIGSCLSFDERNLYHVWCTKSARTKVSWDGTVFTTVGQSGWIIVTHNYDSGHSSFRADYFACCLSWANNNKSLTTLIVP